MLIGLRDEDETACTEASGREEGQSPAAAKKLVRVLGKQRVANMFTHLRKIAQHPLLVRRLFGDEVVAKMAGLAHARYTPTFVLPWSVQKGSAPIAVLLCQVIYSVLHTIDYSAGF